MCMEEKPQHSESELQNDSTFNYIIDFPLLEEAIQGEAELHFLVDFLKERENLKVIICQHHLRFIENTFRKTPSLYEIKVRFLTDFFDLLRSHKISFIIINNTSNQLSTSFDVNIFTRSLVGKHNATLLTSDPLQSSLASIEGVAHELLHLPFTDSVLDTLSSYFDEFTMSVHIYEGSSPKAKRGSPGNWKFENVFSSPSSKEFILSLIGNFERYALNDKHSHVETKAEGILVTQIREYRIVCTHKPISKFSEITITRPVVQMTLTKYNLEPSIEDRCVSYAEGLLIAGRPGAGKSTFAAALANHLFDLKKVVKTLENPRDLQVRHGISQIHLGTHSSLISDTLLLSRPDYIIFDEVRKERDFQLYADLRFAGIGLVGVVHASKAIDAIHRLLGRVDLGVIPSIVDTIIYVEHGTVDSILTLELTTKVPKGMSGTDLARPVVEVKDLSNRRLLYEIFTFGEQTIVAPIVETRHDFGKRRGNSFTSRKVRKEMSRLLRHDDFDISKKKKNWYIIHLRAQDFRRVKKRQKEIEKRLGVDLTFIKQ